LAERAGGIIFNKEFTEILLIKGPLGKREGKWGFPKGHLKPSESYLKGAIREIREETGINIFCPVVYHLVYVVKE
jgi:ADP-ribose pyrophosphatase YjhB (NUDIX family)